MLKELRVQNFALINYANIKFNNALVVITGETGAGKSILLNALAFALGEKSDTSVLFDKTKKTIVEAVFDISELQLQEFFQNHDLDYQAETILRREVNADGKSRAFINDSPVNISVIRELGKQLIDIHSQHQNLVINSAQFRYNFIDAIAGCIRDRMNYTNIFKQYQKLKKELDLLIQQQSTAQKELDYNQYLLSELLTINVQEGELQKLEEELQQLQNAEHIIQKLSLSVQFLRDAEVNAVQLISHAKNNIQSVTKYHPKYEELFQRLQSSITEIKDITSEIENYLTAIEINPERIQTLSERLDNINKLLKKHNVKTDSELLKIRISLEEKLSDIQNIDEVIEQKRKELVEIEKQLIKKAEELSSKRKSVQNKIERECIDMLSALAMPNAQIIIDIQTRTDNSLDEFGIDSIKFLFSANRGVPPADIQKTASGGEISRLMLSMKAMMAKKIQLPTIIFDEIDTGISGLVAGKMSDIMKKMSENMQVIVITHLPQIAAKGQQHFYVSKEEQKDKTISRIEELNESQRVLEIANMLSSGKPGDAAIQNAKELLLK